MTTYRTAKVYLTIANRAPRALWNGTDATVVNATSSPPASVPDGCIVVPVIVKVPKDRWVQFEDAVTVEIPEYEDVPEVEAG